MYAVPTPGYLSVVLASGTLAATGSSPVAVALGAVACLVAGALAMRAAWVRRRSDDQAP